MSNWKTSLIRRVHELDCVQRGDFLLSCGETSDFYIDARKVTLDYFGLKAICDGIQEVTDRLEYYYVGGPSMGADPIVGGCLLTLWDLNGGFLVRKEAKGHGTNNFIEGEVGDDYLLVEDVTTTGFSLKRCIDLIGHDPVAVVTVLDRGGKDYGFGCPFFSLLTLKDIGLGHAQV